MRVNITCKGFTANEKQTALIEKKFQKLEKFFSDDIVVNVTMGYKKKRQIQLTNYSFFHRNLQNMTYLLLNQK